MGQKSKIVAFIPARGGSKSICLKNIRLIAGKPLIYWCLSAALSCEYIDEVYVSTDSNQIRDVVLQMAHDAVGKLRCISRSSETATDEASTESAMIEFAEKYDFEHVVLIQATNPLLTSYDLSKAVKLYRTESFDSIISLVRQKRFLWTAIDSSNQVSPVNYSPDHRPRRQEFEGYLVENGAFYITSKSRLLSSGCRISGRIGYYEMNEASYFEIDEPSDWVLIEKTLQEQNRTSDIREKARNIKLFAMDCDGVLTDGGMYYSENGDECKKFNTRDGMGIAMLHERGIETAIITGEDTDIVRQRAIKLNIAEVCLGVKNKLQALREMVDRRGVSLNEVAYIGDDINDLDAMRAVGVAFAVNDATEIIRGNADYVTRLKGGYGAVREAIELIINALSDRNERTC